MLPDTAGRDHQRDPPVNDKVPLPVIQRAQFPAVQLQRSGLTADPRLLQEALCFPVPGVEARVRKDPLRKTVLQKHREILGIPHKKRGKPRPDQFIRSVCKQLRSAVPVDPRESENGLFAAFHGLFQHPGRG